MNVIGGDAIEMLQRAVREAAQNFRPRGNGRRAAFFRWREPDAAAAGGARGQLGRHRRDGSIVPARDARSAVFGGACCRRAFRARARRWLRIVLHGDRVQASAESYIGLVEVSVGLIPAGGGTKEMLLR